MVRRLAAYLDKLDQLTRFEAKKNEAQSRLNSLEIAVEGVDRVREHAKARPMLRVTREQASLGECSITR